jgi:hypothetical protein
MVTNSIKPALILPGLSESLHRKSTILLGSLLISTSQLTQIFSYNLLLTCLNFSLSICHVAFCSQNRMVYFDAKCNTMSRVLLSETVDHL